MLSVLAEFQREFSVSNTNKDSPQPTPADASEAAARRGDGQCPSPPSRYGHARRLRQPGTNVIFDIP